MEKLETSYIQSQYEVLGHSGLGFTEVRIPKKNINTFNKDLNALNTSLIPYLKGDAYVGINPRKNEKGTAQDVAMVTCLVIDLDPIRDSGVASSDKLWKQAIGVANTISESYPNSIVVSSGSGAHLYIPVKAVEATPEIAARLKSWGNEIKKKYETAEIAVDNIFDLPRIIRVWGSWNEKSNRLCEPLSPILTREPIDFDSVVPKLKYEVLATNVNSTKYEEKAIPNGFRNSTLVSLAGTMRRKGISESGIMAALMEENMAKCKPPLPEEEVKAIAKSVVRYEPKNEVSAHVKSISDSYFNDLKDRKPGLMTGFGQLDQMLAGLKPGRLYVVAARPTDGKTTFLTQIAKNLAESSVRVLFFPTEVGASAIFDKLVSSSTGINLRKFQWGNFNEGEKKTIQDKRNSLSCLSTIIAEDFSLTTEKIEQTIKTIMPDVVIVDFLQSMYFEEGGSPKEYAKAVIALKSFAGKYQIPVILASQLNRSSEGNPLSLGHLKGSGTIEEQGDEILFLHTLDKLVYPRPVNLYVMKSKYGETGIVKLDFYASTCEFKEKS